MFTKYLRNRFYLRGTSALGIFNTVWATVFNRVLIECVDTETKDTFWKWGKGTDFPPVEQPKLSIYFNSHDWIIAYSPKDAAEVFEDHYGESWEDYAESNEFVLESKIDYNMICEDDPHDSPQPKGAMIAKSKYGLWVMTASREAWIEHVGRGFLGSVDW